MRKVEKRVKQITLITSAFIALSLVVIAYIKLGPTPILDEYVFFAVVAATLPAAVLSYSDYRWRKAVDEQLPELLRNVVQAQETGMTLPQALEEAAKRDYGPLTHELRKMTSQISWGRTFEDALQALERRVNTVLMRRTSPMIVEASRSGGRVERIFAPLGEFVRTALLFRKEREGQTRPYIAIVYVAFFVFLFTIILLFKSFFASVEGLPILGSAVMAPLEMKRVFFQMACVQAFFGGLVAGKMGEGTISAGLKHSLILMLLGYTALKLFI